ncbi:MAG: hypothetical protein KDD47_20630, partial [Acidobacteria bacterium]|nr:hypothetical protein [Acidobacteriota bacterium]
MDRQEKTVGVLERAAPEIFFEPQRRFGFSLPGNEPARFEIRLEAGAFVRLHFSADAPGERQEIRLLSPRGRLLSRCRWRPRAGGAKEVLLYAEEAGRFRIEVSSRDPVTSKPRASAAWVRLSKARGRVSDRHRTEASWALEAAEIAFEEGDLAIASGGYHIAREHFAAAADNQGEARAWCRSGEVLFRQRDPGGALETWAIALSKCQGSRDGQFRARLLLKVGEAQMALGKP